MLRGRAGAAVEAAAALLEPAAHDAEEAQGLAKATTPLAPGGRFKAEMCGAVFRAYAAAVEAGSAAAQMGAICWRLLRQRGALDGRMPRTGSADGK